MDLNEKNKELRMLASKLGMCNDFSEIWCDDKSDDELITMFKEGIDFCIDKDYPSSEIIHKHFGNGSLRRNHVYVDEKSTHGIRLFVCNISDIIVVQGDSDMELYFTGFNFSTIYVRHNAKVKISCDGSSKVNIMAYDNCHIDISVSEKASASVKCKSENVKVKAKGGVKLIK